MRDEEITGAQEEMDEIVEGTAESSGKYEKLIQDGENKYKLTGMYRDWFLDYASYVILERAVPHITDGFKPVQRRIMHAMKNIDDGRYNKVANIIGQTMQYHPHGDASIGDALVQLLFQKGREFFAEQSRCSFLKLLCICCFGTETKSVAEFSKNGHTAGSKTFR